MLIRFERDSLISRIPIANGRMEIGRRVSLAHEYI